MLRLHVGCGARAERSWINIDADVSAHSLTPSEIEVKEVDVRRGIPFGAGAIEMIYTEHFVEHLTRDEGQRFFFECARVLQVDGLMRISTPDLSAVVEAYRNGELEVWKPVGYVPATACQMVNESLTWWGHRFTYDFSELTDALQMAGFRNIVRRSWRESLNSNMLTEGRPFCRDLIVEATK